MQMDVVVVSGVRTVIGKSGVSLEDLPPTELGSLAVLGLLARADIEGGQVSHVVFGAVIATEPKGFYLDGSPPAPRARWSLGNTHCSLPVAFCAAARRLWMISKQAQTAMFGDTITNRQ